MTITNPEPTLTVTLNKAEIEYIRHMTQNSNNEETDSDNKIRLELFVAASRAIGFDMNTDGSVNRSMQGVGNG